jgi:hypothetical protein
MQFSTQRVEALQGDSENWHAVGTTNDFGVTFQNSWANVGGSSPAGFYKDRFNVVWLRGNIDTGVSGSIAFTLPVGYRPEYNTVQIVYNNNGGPGPGGANVYVTVQSDGDVIPTYSAGTDAWLDGVMFRAT